MVSARPAAPGFFPLDDELALLAGQLTPELHERLAELGAWMPFDQARRTFARFTRVTVSEPSARRTTEAAGAACVALATAAVAELEQHAPTAPAGATKLVLEVDGAMVPVVGGEWVEAKTVVIGAVCPPEVVRGERVVKTRELSYFSRYADAETFERLALVEIHRRGVENAREVGAVNDGAEWIQGFLDAHAPQATRILDFPHAAGYVAQIGQAQFGADTPEIAAWLQDQLHGLKHAGPAELLSSLRRIVAEHPQAQALELPQALAYLEKRTAQMQYPDYQARGWPIGSGAVESGQKMVVEARLQGSGMHWAPVHIDPMLALRNMLANERWDETWPQIEQHLRRQTQLNRNAHRQKRQARSATPSPPPVPAMPQVKRKPARSRASDPARPHGSRKPAPNHPWRRSYKTIPSKV